MGGTASASLTHGRCVGGDNLLCLWNFAVYICMGRDDEFRRMHAWMEASNMHAMRTRSVVGLGLMGSSIVVSLLVVVWALRLGSLLVLRVFKVGHDSRFDEVKRQPGKCGPLQLFPFVAIVMCPMDGQDSRYDRGQEAARQALANNCSFIVNARWVVLQVVKVRPAVCVFPRASQ